MACLRGRELKNAAERVCNGYSNLTIGATAEVVRAHTIMMLCYGAVYEEGERTRVLRDRSGIHHAYDHSMGTAESFDYLPTVHVANALQPGKSHRSCL